MAAIGFLFLVSLPAASAHAQDIDATSGSPSAKADLPREEFLRAVSSDDTLRVETMLAGDRGLANLTNDLSEPVLVAAARNVNLEMVAALLEAGAVVDATGWRRTTALETVLHPLLSHPRFRAEVVVPAARSNRLALARALLEHRASIFHVGEFGQIPIAMACQRRDAELVDFLLLNQDRRDSRDAAGNSLIHLAALWARTNVLRALAARGSDLQATNTAGFTPLQAVSRLPGHRERFFIDHRWQPGLDADGSQHRDESARLLIDLGASMDIFSITALGWTNELAELVKKDPELVRSQDHDAETPLHWAAEFGATNTAGLLLRAGADVGATNRQGSAALDVSAARAQNGMAALLIEHGARVHRFNRKGPIHSAAEQGNADLVKLLLRAGESPDAADEHGASAFDLAVRANRERVAKLLLAYHASLKTGPAGVATPLHWAAANGNTNLLALIIGHGADVNALDEAGRTPLLLAHERDNLPVMEFLLARGADINAADTNGNTALHLRAAAAADTTHDPFQRTPAPAPRSIMAFLLEHGASVNSRNTAGETPLHRVAAKTFSQSNAVEQARQWIEPLLRHHANLRARDSKGRTPLLSAVPTYNIPFIETLLSLGVDLRSADSSGSTALHLLLESKPPGLDYSRQTLFLKWLLEHGTRVGAADKTGTTPVHLAVTGTVDYDVELPILTLLLASGADVNKADRLGRTPFHVACGNEGNRPFGGALWRAAMVLPGDAKEFESWWADWNETEDSRYPAILLGHGALVNKADRGGNTALHYAARAARTNTVALLLEHGADRSLRNRQGKTPLQSAYESRMGDWVVPLLRLRNAPGEIGEAAWANDLDRVRAFLEDDPANANATWLWGSSPLHWACNEGHLEMVKLLLSYGARVNPPPHVRTDTNRMEELNRIQNYIHSRRIQPGTDLLANKARPSEFQEDGGVSLTMTPLQLAIANGHNSIASLLVKHGAEVDLSSAAYLGMNGAVGRLVRTDPRRANEFSRRSSWFFQPSVTGFNCNSRSCIQSGTPLHSAVRGRQSKTVAYLLGAGADPAVLDDEGRSPLQLAIEMGQPETVALLMRWEEDRTVKPR